MLDGNLQQFDDEHLIASAHQAMDPLTATPLERELLRRFEELVDERTDYADYADVIAAIDEFEFDADDIKALAGAVKQSVPYTVAMLKVLADAGIDDEYALKASLDLAQACDDVGIDDAEALARELAYARQARGAAQDLAALVNRLTPQPATQERAV